jgi:hypothetical protein
MTKHETPMAAQPQQGEATRGISTHDHQDQTPPPFSQSYEIDANADRKWVRQEYGESYADTPPNLTAEQVMTVMEHLAEIAELEHAISAHTKYDNKRSQRPSSFPSHPSSPNDFGPPRAP